MSDNLKLTLTLDANGNLVSVVKNAGDAVGGLSDKAKESSKAFDGLSSTIETVGKVAATALAFGGISASISEIISTTAEFQRLNAALTTVEGSAYKAELSFKQIQDFAKNTPYQLSEVTDAFIKMKSLGLDASEEAMTSYGNTASGLGKSLNQMIEAVADAATGEFERLKEFGIKAKQEGDNVSLTFKGVTTQIGNNAKEIEQYLINIGNVDFAGGMMRQMDTLGGRISNLQDSWAGAFNALGTAAEPAINASIASLSDLADGVKVAADYMDEAGKVAATGLAVGLTAAAIPAIVSAGTAMTASAVAAGGFTAAMVAASRAAAAFALTPIGAALTAAGAAALYLTTRTDETATAVEKLTAQSKALNLEMSGKEIKQQADQLVTLNQKLESLLELKKQNASVDILGTKEADLRKQIAAIEDLSNAKKELKTQSELLLEQEQGMGTQLEMLYQQTRDFGVSVDDVSKSLDIYTAATKTANEYSKGGKDIIASLQEEYALLGLSAKEAAVQKAAFTAISKGASKDEVEFIKQTVGAIQDKKEAIKKIDDAEKASAAASKKFHEDSLKRTEEAKKALDDKVKAIQSATDRIRAIETEGLDDLWQKNQEYNKNLATLVNNGLLDREAMIAKSAQRQYEIDLETFGKQELAAKKQVDVTKDAIKQQEEQIKRLDAAFTNVWEGILDGSGNAFDGVKNMFVSLLAELAHEAITKPIMIQVGQSMGLLGGTSSGSSALSSVGGASGFLGSVGSTLGGVGSGLSSGWNFATSAEFAGSNMATSAMLESGSYAAAAGNAIATYAPYVAAAIALDSLAGGQISTGIMGGSRSEQTRDATLSYNASTGADASVISGSHYDAGWGRSGDWLQTEMLDTAAKTAIESTINTMAQTIQDNGSKLGYAFEDGLNIEASIAGLKGKTAEEMGAAISGLMSEIGTKLIQGMDDSVGKPLSDSIGEWAKAGESLDTTFTRVIDQFNDFEDPLGILAGSVYDLSMESLDAVDNLAALAGGIGNLNALNRNFVNEFATEAQKMTLTTTKVVDVFGDLGIAIPASETALFDMVTQLQHGTEAEQAAAIAIMANTSAIGDYYDNLGKAETAQINATKASNDLTDAQGKLITASTNLTTAENALKTAQADTKTTAEQLKTAQDKVTTAQKDLTTANTNLQTATTNNTTAQATLKDILAATTPKATTLSDAIDDIGTSATTAANSATTAATSIAGSFGGLFKSLQGQITAVANSTKIVSGTQGTSTAVGTSTSVLADTALGAATIEGVAKSDWGNFIDLMYQEVLGRDADKLGKAWYEGQLDTGAISVQTFIDSLIGGATGKDVDTLKLVNGSHADGLDYVPYDGYIAELHKGERVLTAQENAGMSTNAATGVTTMTMPSWYNDYIKTGTIATTAIESVSDAALSAIDLVRNSGVQANSDYLKAIDFTKLATPENLLPTVAPTVAPTIAPVVSQSISDAASKTQSLTDKILELTDATAYNKLMRERELSALTDSDKALQQRIYTLQDSAVAEKAASDAMQAAVATAQSDVSNAQNALTAAVNAQKSEYDAYYNRAKDDATAASNERVSALQKEVTTTNESISKLKSLAGALKSVSETLAPKYSNTATDMQRATSEIMGYVNQGIAPAQEDVQAALDRVKDQDTTYYADAISYARDQAMANNATTDLLKLVNKNTDGQEATLTRINQSIKDEQQALSSSLNALKLEYDAQTSILNKQLDEFGLGTAATLSVKTAIDNLNAAIMALANAKAAAPPVAVSSVTYTSGGYTGSTTTYSNGSVMTADPRQKTKPSASLSMPAFASGGDHTGGIRLVGENGPELELTGASRIFNTQQTQKILSGSQSDSSDVFKAVLEELKALKAEMSRMRNEQDQHLSGIKKHTKDTADLSRKADAIGLKVEVIT